jgi:hypothetical protein
LAHSAQNVEQENVIRDLTEAELKALEYDYHFTVDKIDSDAHYRWHIYRLSVKGGQPVRKTKNDNYVFVES